MNALKHAPTPITMAPQIDVIPHKYILHRHEQTCTHCGHVHVWSQVYSMTHLRSRMGSKFVTNLRPLDHAPEWNLAVEERPIASSRVPFCHDCIQTLNLKHLPTPKVESPTAPSWVGAGDPYDLKKKQKDKKKGETTIDDLLNL